MDISGKRIGLVNQYALGDAMSTLPMAAAIKASCSSAQVVFIGNGYTKPLIMSSPYVDEFYHIKFNDNKYTDEMVELFKKMKLDIIIHVRPHQQIMAWAKKANIRIRIGTTRRLYSFFYNNRFVNNGRSSSIKHETLYNLDLLKPLKLKENRNISLIEAMQVKPQPLLQRYKELLVNRKFKLVIHPGAMSASSRNWTMEQYGQLLKTLPAEDFQVVFTGSAGDQKLCDQLYKQYPDALNLCGQLSIAELVSLYGEIDAIVAPSTGPLHIAAALGKFAVGLYAATKVHSSTRWGPIGGQAIALSPKEECEGCNAKDRKCICVESVPVNLVSEIMRVWQSGSKDLYNIKIPDHVKLWSVSSTIG